MFGIIPPGNVYREARLLSLVVSLNLHSSKLWAGFPFCAARPDRLYHLFESHSLTAPVYAHNSLSSVVLGHPYPVHSLPIESAFSLHIQDAISHRACLRRHVRCLYVHIAFYHSSMLTLHSPFRRQLRSSPQPPKTPSQALWNRLPPPSSSLPNGYPSSSLSNWHRTSLSLRHRQRRHVSSTVGSNSHARSC